MEKVKLDCSKISEFVSDEDIYKYRSEVEKYHDVLHNINKKDDEYLGWVELPSSHDKQEFERIKKAGKKIQNQSNTLVVVGIGGSYLGARTALNMLKPNFFNELPKQKDKGVGVYFAGHNLSSEYLSDLIELLDTKDISINVISKSGTTLEPALAFRVLKEYMENRYGKTETADRIFVTTDKEKGALKELANEEGYESFTVPDDIGGRYSVLTPVGLLPMVSAGIDVDEVIKGAKEAEIELSKKSIEDNDSYKYAVIRNILYKKGKIIEVLVNYNPKMFYFGEWFKQLFGESEGKEGKGIFPTSLNYTTDLHSMGQYIQDGRKNIFETVVNINKQSKDLIIKSNNKNLDGLNYLDGKNFSYVNQKAMEGTLDAHVEGKVPNIIFDVPEISAYYFGYLTYFFMKSCGMSGYLLGVNPFNQPGVEFYKKNMYKLLKD